MKHPMQSVDVDEKMATITNSVDWNAVSEADAASFGLAVGIYRDSRQVYDIRRAVWGTSVGGVVSICVLSMIALLTCGAATALSIVIFSQMFRSLSLWWNMKESRKDVVMLEQQAIATAESLPQG